MCIAMIACLLMSVGTIKGENNIDKELEETMYYIAQEGDTVERIAGRFDLWPSDRLYKLNNKDGKKRWRIKKGDRVRVRQEPATYIRSEPAVTNAYAETLWNIRGVLNQATVTYYVFSAFGGLLRLTDHVDMVSGKILGETNVEPIVEYECGVRY